MLINDVENQQVVLSEIRPMDFVMSCSGLFEEYRYPMPMIGIDDWESFEYLITKGKITGSLPKRIVKWLKKVSRSNFRLQASSNKILIIFLNTRLPSISI